MNIKGYTGWLVAVCTVTGLAIGSALVMGYRSLDEEAHRLGAESLAIKQVHSLDDYLGFFLQASDQVLKEGSSSAVNTALLHKEQFDDLIDGLEFEPLVADRRDLLDELQGGVAAIQELTWEGAKLDTADPGPELERLFERQNAIAGPLPDLVADLVTQMNRRARYHEEELAAAQSFLVVLTWIAAAAYLAIVFMTWLWSVQTMVRPIEQLSVAAELATLDNDAFEVESSGPEEVQRLTRNISTFVRTRADFLATMSHELRTPLNGIINLNELMLETRLDDEQRELVRSAKTAGESLLAIINDILDFSKIQARKLQIEQAEFDVRELADSALEIIVSEAAKKGLTVLASVAADVPAAVVGDQTRLRQVLVNLLNNAVKFTTTGSVALRIEIANAAEGTARTDTADESATADSAAHQDAVTSAADGDATPTTGLRFTIQDTGCGIPPNAIDTLFKAFQQGDSSTTRKFGGTGLGLAICRELCALMGGEIGVESVVDEGSEFWFTVAVAAPTADTAIEAATTTAALPEEVRNRRVLVASRHPTRTEGILAQLTAIGLPRSQVATFESDGGELAEQLAADSRAWVLFDPEDRASADPDELLRTIAGQRSGDSRIGVLEWRVLRGPRNAALPSHADRVPLATSLAGVEDWLRGRLAIDADDDTQCDSEDRTRRVLVVDDNPVNRRIASSFLERAGFVVTCAADGQEAIDQLLERAADAVLMDRQMPRLDGLEATRRLRELEGGDQLATDGNVRLPIIGLTAGSAGDELDACRDAGMDDVLTKPFKARDLVAAVRRAIAARPNAAADPRTAPAGDGPAAEPSHGPSEPAASDRRTALVVDDNAMNQRVAKAVMQKAGFDVVVVDNGQLAVDYLADGPCDIVLMDCQMPVLDGWEATRAIRELEEFGRLGPGVRSPLPILAVTANAMEGDRERCLDAGMNDHISKPIKPRVLLAAVDKYLRSGRATART